jgi:SET domain-containing protein
MVLLEDQLVVKRSSLPGAGKGLFTKKFIPKGASIVEYKGRITTWKEVDHDEGTNGYIFYVKRDHVIDAAPYKKALARFANDARGLARIKGIANNAEYKQRGLRVFIKATKDIPAGSEILVDYGKEYWQVIRYNNRLARAENSKREQ